jgi:ribonuclease HI
MSEYVIFTDGAYSSSRKQGGSAFVILKDRKKVIEWSKSWKGGTNNTAEILAILCALNMFQKPVDSITIYSDSQYCLGCIFKDWKRKKNIKLWRIFDKVFEKVTGLCSSIHGIHVDGHQKDDAFTTKWNNYCDRLAVEASRDEITK